MKVEGQSPERSSTAACHCILPQTCSCLSRGSGRGRERAPEEAGPAQLAAGGQ